MRFDLLLPREKLPGKKSLSSNKAFQKNEIQGREFCVVGELEMWKLTNFGVISWPLIDSENSLVSKSIIGCKFTANSNWSGLFLISDRRVKGK